MTLPQALVKLSRSKFRGRFKLGDEDRQTVIELGPEGLRQAAMQLLSPRVFPAEPVNDGHQTPLKGHPVFKAMHATATCCRNCMNHWWQMPKGVALTEVQQTKVVNLVLAWIDMQMNGGIEVLKQTMSPEELATIPFWSGNGKKFECPYRKTSQPQSSTVVANPPQHET